MRYLFFAALVTALFTMAQGVPLDRNPSAGNIHASAQLDR